MELNIIYNKDALTGLKELPDECVDCCVTSPPYFSLRSYLQENDKDKYLEIGTETTPEIFIEKLADIFDEVKRVLKKDGTLWVNIGDSYNGSGNDSGKKIGSKSNSGIPGNRKVGEASPTKATKVAGLKPKDLIGIPWMLAFELRKRGWYLRQEITWVKPNPMPESVTDRCTKNTESIFLLAKSQKYYFDHLAIQQVAKYDGRKDTMMKGSDKYLNGFAPKGVNTNTVHKKGHERWQTKETKSHIFGNRNGELNGVHSGKAWTPQTKVPQNAPNDKRGEHTITAKNYGLSGKGFEGHSGYDILENPYVANKRSAWIVNTKSFKECHFATFPEKLIVDCIKAGSKEGGVVLNRSSGLALRD